MYNKKKQLQPRAEPDGAVASPNTSPTSSTIFTAAKSQETCNNVDTKTPYILRLIDQRSGKDKIHDFNSKPPSPRGGDTVSTNCQMKTALHQPPPTTEVLSEFRTTRREYIEYRTSAADRNQCDSNNYIDCLAGGMSHKIRVSSVTTIISFSKI